MMAKNEETKKRASSLPLPHTFIYHEVQLHALKMGHIHSHCVTICRGRGEVVGRGMGWVLGKSLLS